MAGIFKNEYCEFLPYAVVEFDGETFPIGFKAVTAADHQSLNLRKNLKGMTPSNKRILTYEPGNWVEVEPERIVPSKVDWGGLWCARTPSDANALAKYFSREHGLAEVIPVLMKAPIYAQPDRVKCSGVFSLGEMDVTPSPDENRLQIATLAEKLGIRFLI